MNRLYRFNQIFKTDFLNLAINPMWLFYCILFPALMALILGFLSSGSYGHAVSAYDYYGITMMLYAIFNTATISANSFMEERIKSGNMRIIFSPVKPFYIHFSKLLATFVFASVCNFLSGVILYFTAGVNYGVEHLGYILILMLLGELFASSLGVLLCCIFKSEGITNQILSLTITFFAMLGGLFFPLDGYGKLLEGISRISPIKWVAESVFSIIYDKNFNLFLPTCTILVLMTAAAVLLSVKFFKTEDYI